MAGVAFASFCLPHGPHFTDSPPASTQVCVGFRARNQEFLPRRAFALAYCFAIVFGAWPWQHCANVVDIWENRVSESVGIFLLTVFCVYVFIVSEKGWALLALFSSACVDSVTKFLQRDWSCQMTLCLFLR